MLSYINKEYLKTQELKLKFKNNKPFPYLVLKCFFNSEFIEQIYNSTKIKKFTFKNSDLFKFYQSSDLSNTKDKRLQKLYKLLNSKELKDYIFKITDLNVPGITDCYSFVYKKTNYLLPHDDSSEKRVIAYVINLSKNFTESSGGSLQFFNKSKIVKTILPEFNSLVLFKVIPGKTFHQVSEVLEDKERYTITGWFNDK